MTLQFSNKAGTLLLLEGKLTHALIPQSHVIRHENWTQIPNSIVDSIKEKFGSSTIIIRSSSRGEDQHTQSMAGAFLSIANICASDTTAVINAINAVFSSYHSLDDNEILFIQHQITEIGMSGVLFTRENSTLAPYYIINYDDVTTRTDTVTSGKGENLKTYVRARSSPFPVKEVRLARLLGLANELEEIFGTTALDIEFALTTSGDLYLLQVRPLSGRKQSIELTDLEFSKYLHKIYRKLLKVSGRHYGLFGQQAVFSVMSDWNPAEMIGIKPRGLAYSLYRELITDSTWSEQRFRYGYRDLRGVPLMLTFLGNPYIDVRASFNSFVPEELSDTLAAKVVDHYINELLKSPQNHDKVEFNIVFSCYYLNLSDKITRLKTSGFSDLDLDRIKFALLNLTNRITDRSVSPFQEDLKSLSLLGERFERLQKTALTDLEKIYWLIEDCKRYGTLPFAGLARAGFIAVQLLNSFVESNIITTTEKNEFLGSLNTVARQLSTDQLRMATNELTKEEFLKKYGHLRPGTYNILSPRYDENFQLYFEDSSTIQSASHKSDEFIFTDQMLNSLGSALKDNGLRVGPVELIGFIKEAIESREYAKFLFTRNLSEILRLLKHIGSQLSISVEDISYSSIRTIKDFYGELSHYDVPDILAKDIIQNKRSHDIAQWVQLPQVISDPSQVYDFWLSDVEPNFITQGNITAAVVREEALQTTSLTQKIIFIKGADPGYDWLFSKDIGGLITQYGGANSHMAIRCAELSIPAIIGCGEINFKRWSQADILEVDCASRHVQIISKKLTA